MSGWPTVKIADVTELKPGFAFKSKLYADSGVRLLRGDNIAQGQLRWQNAKHWPVHLASEFEDFFLKEGDVVLAMDRPWISAGLKWSWVRVSDLPALLVQRVARLRARSNLDQRFLRYIIGAPSFTDHVQTILTGVNVPHISGRDIQSHMFELPPLPIQKRIAGILSAYDDLIAVNERRIAILEEMTRRVFEERFGEFINGQIPTLDDVPIDWNVCPISRIVKFIGGGTPSKKAPDFWNGEINWFTPTDLTKGGRHFFDRSSDQITELGLKRSSAKMFPAYSIMMTSRATIGAMAINATEATTNQGFITFLPDERTPMSFLWHVLKASMARIEAVATGATFKEVGKGRFGELLFAVPPDRDVHRYESVARPMFDGIQSLERQKTNLRAARDLLLPRLISGEIDVSEAPVPNTAAAE